MATKIYTLEQLQAVNNNLTADYKLMNNIDASDTSTWNDGAGFDPIGDETVLFTGNFDGQGYTIDSLFVNRPTESLIGALFGYTQGGKIKNTNLTNVDVTGKDSVGGFVGNPDAATNLFSDCSVQGVVHSTASSAGTGGFVGYGCTSFFERCSADVNITGVGIRIGGFVGNAGTHTDCYCTGSVDGTSQYGGFSGVASTNHIRCYAAGEVNSGVDISSGFSGIGAANSTDCFFDTQTTGQATTFGNATGETTANMKKQATFINWNFIDVWSIDEGNSYPIFQREVELSWSTTALSTTASLAKYEREINSLVESSGTEYLSDGFNIAVASGNSSSEDVSDGMIEIICKVATQITIKDTKELTISMEDSADDITFAAISTGALQYTKTASGDETITAGTELFRWVVPTNIEDYVRCAITSDATNSGTLDIYTNSKWSDKISIAKDKIKNMLETWLVDRGYKDYPDYDSDEVLIDLIANPSTFAVASDYLTLHYIFRDLGLKSGEDSIWYDKAKTYLQDFKEEFNEAVRRITLDIDQDGSADTGSPENWTPKLIV